MNYRSTAMALLAITLTVGIALPLFNLVVDPFQAFGSPGIPGVNAERPVAATRGRLSKSLAVCRKQPDLAILGASRTEFLFNPDYEGLKAVAKRPYNLALAGTGMDELNRTLAHAHFAGGVKTAVVTLELLGFNAYREDIIYKNIVIDFDESNLIEDSEENCFSLFSKKMSMLAFSGTSLRESVKTISMQGAIDTHLYLDNGYRDEYTMSRWNLQSSTPQSNAFISQTQSYLNKVWFPQPSGRFCLENANSSSIEKFRRMVEFARAHDIRLVFALTPDHAFLQLAKRRVGLEPYYERWRREMVAVLAEDARKNPTAPKTPLWDFTTLDAINSEPRPPAGVPSRDQSMRYWFEATHSRSEVGEYMVDRMFGHRRPGKLPPEGFGVELTPETIEGHIMKMRRDLDAYAAAYPRDVEDIDRLAREMPAREHLPSYCSLELKGAEPPPQVERVALKPPVVIDHVAAAKYAAEGQAFVDAGKPAAARRAFDQAIKRSPPSANLYFQRANVNLTLRDFDKARSDLLALQTLDPGNKAAAFLMQTLTTGKLQADADALRAKGRNQEALQIYSKIIDATKEPDASLYFLRGALRLDTGNARGAISDFEAGLKLDPGNTTLAALKSKALDTLGAQVVQARTTTNPAEAANLQRQADALRAEGKRDEALVAYDRAIAVSPPNTALHYLRGTLRQEAGDIAGAIADFEAGLKLDPANATLMSLRDAARAALAARAPAAPAPQPSRTDPVAAATLQRMADALRQDGKRDEALAAYDGAIAISPPNTALHYMRGTLRQEAGDIAGAIADFEAGLKFDPANAALKFLRDAARAALAAQTTAAAPQRQAATDPAAAATLQRQADALRAEGRRDEALAAYDRAVALSPPNTALHYLRGTLRQESGDTAGAIADFEAGLKLDPANAALNFLLQGLRAAETQPAPEPVAK